MPTWKMVQIEVELIFIKVERVVAFLEKLMDSKVSFIFFSTTGLHQVEMVGCSY